MIIIFFSSFFVVFTFVCLAKSQPNIKMAYAVRKLNIVVVGQVQPAKAVNTDAISGPVANQPKVSRFNKMKFVWPIRIWSVAKVECGFDNVVFFFYFFFRKGFL